jgi:uncharacterized protein YegP (UPF0339 family)
MDREDLKLAPRTDVQGRHYWIIISGNNKTMAMSPRFHKDEAEYKQHLKAFLQEDDFDLYKDNANEWRWRTWSMIDGKKVKTGKASEGYKNRGDCEKYARLILTSTIVS